MSATFIDRHFSRTHEIIGFRARERAAFDHAGLIMIGDYAPDFAVRAHYHPDVMIDTVIAGSGMYQWPRQRTRCVTGTLIVARAGEVHDTRPDAGGMTIVSMVAPPHWLRDADIGCATSRDTPPHPRAALQVFRLVRELHLMDASSALVIQELALHTFADALGCRAEHGPWRAPPSWMKRVMARLCDDLSAPVSLRSLAEEIGVHFTHLARVFRAHQGCTIGEFQRMRRIQKSVTRLVDSRVPLAQVALQAGFCDQSHFHRCFRRYLGMSPGAFRRRAARFDSRRLLVAGADRVGAT